MLTFTAEERKDYQESVKDYWDYYSTMKTAHKKGLVEGRAEGRAEGILSVASNLKRSGMSLDEIAKMTGLPVQEIENL